MPTGSKGATAKTTSHLQTKTATEQDMTRPVIATQQQQPQDVATEPAKTKKPSRHRRRRAPQIKVCTTALKPANEETATDDLTQWLQELEKEDWWPQDQTTKNPPATSETTAAVNMFSIGKPRRSQRIKKEMATG